MILVLQTSQSNILQASPSIWCVPQRLIQQIFTGEAKYWAHFQTLEETKGQDFFPLQNSQACE